MTSVILPPLSDPSAFPKSGLPSQRPDARYNFLAQSILNSLGENGGISLVVADSSVESGFLRETLEQIHGRLSVFEVPCRPAMAGERIISSLPEFISSASAAPFALARPGQTGAGQTGTSLERRHAPMLFICDGAEGLADEQIETMYSLSRGRHGPLGVVLLAKPEFLLRMQNARLNHIRAALSACFWSQQSSYGAVVAADGQDQPDGVMPLNPAQLPSPLLERLTTQIKEAEPEPSRFSVQRGGARAEGSRFARTGRYRRAIDVVFSIGYLLVGAGTAAGLWWMSSHPQTMVVSEAPAPPPLSLSLPRQESEGAVSASARPAATPPSVPEPNLAAKIAPAASVVPTPTNTAEKGVASVPIPAEPLKQQEDATPLAAAKPVEKTVPATIPAALTPAKSDARVPETRLSDGDRAVFAQRGNELLAAGDIASARLFFERAANAGDAGSALGMAKTFDPLELAKAGVRGVKGDPAKADYWYQRARLLAGTGPAGSK
jgi:hypothetical protein